MTHPLSVHVDNISLHINNTPILSDLSFSVPSPKFVAILGPSGVGKSSLLHTISGTLPFQKGSILINQRLSPSPPLAALLTQHHTLLPWFDILNNVMIGFRLRGKISPDVRQQASQLLEKVGLLHHASSYPHALSGGMQQRVMLARTLLEHQKLVLLDEPFSALDAITRHQIGLTARELLQDRLTLMVTHDPLEALRLADQILIMTKNHGPLVEITLPNIPPPRPHSHPEIISLHEQILQHLLHHHPISLNAHA